MKESDIFPAVNTSRGAPMGRHDIKGNPHKGYKFRLFKVSLDAGGYDSGGAYWGHGPETLYIAFTVDDETNKLVRVFYRGHNRQHVKGKITEDYPNAKFYR